LSGSGGQSSSTMRKRVAIEMRSAYGGLPVQSSTMVHPSDQISDSKQAPLSSIISGAIQLGVPATTPSSTFFIFKLSETPKSVNLTLPPFVVNILAAFKSQCTTYKMDEISSRKGNGGLHNKLKTIRT